jgi:PAS domain S-box-containing protein
VVFPASHDPRLVLLSILISVLAAYTAAALSGRIRHARGRAWIAWLAGGATADGIGTWSMHYTGKLALRLPVPLRFDWRQVIVSLLVGMIGSALAFAVASRSKVGWMRALAAGSALGGVGVAGLHFTAMSAMRLPGLHHQYRSPALVTLSIVLAIVFSTIALPFTFHRLDDQPGPRARYHLNALLRGAANPVMHYTAMTAVVFVPSTHVAEFSRTVSISSLGLLGISIVPVMVLVVALVTPFVDRLQRQRALLDELFEQGPEAVALLNRDGKVVRVNREFTRLFGYTSEEMREPPGIELLMPGLRRDDPTRKVLAALQNGQRQEGEDVRRRKDGTQLHVAILGVPVSVPGGQFAIYAIYRDITARINAEEASRTYNRRLIEAQEAERQRMARELHDEIGQILTGAGMMLKLSKQLPPDQSQARVAEAQSLLDDLIGRVRNLAVDLRPAILDDLGLIAALEAFFQRYSAQTGVQIDLEQHNVEGRRFESGTETAAYRIVQEALTNVARHAGAPTAVVRISASDETLTVIIVDRGGGFDPQVLSSRSSVGLTGMRERARVLGGHLTIATSAEGTRISAELPLRGSPD